MKTISLFCLPQNKMADATIEYINGEYIASWKWTEGEEEKSHFVKFPSRDSEGNQITADHLKEWIEKHNTHNVPVVTNEDIEAEKAQAESILEGL